MLNYNVGSGEGVGKLKATTLAAARARVEQACFCWGIYMYGEERRASSKQQRELHSSQLISLQPTVEDGGG